MSRTSTGAPTTICIGMNDIMYCEEPIPLDESTEYTPPQDSGMFRVDVSYVAPDKKLEKMVEEN